MQSSHAAAAVSSAFDDPNLIAYGGLGPVVRLAERCGLPALADEHIHLPCSKDGIGAFPAAKLMSLVGGMVAGADSIEDMDRLRHGAMPRLFTGVRAPSTLGSFLRSFTHGHVKQLHAVARRLLPRLAAHTPLLPGADQVAHVDIDDTIRRTHGYAKQGTGYGYSKVNGVNALLGVVSTPLAAPVIAATRLRKGPSNSARGAAAFVAETIRTARACGASGLLVVRADSAFYGADVVGACRSLNARFSITVRMNASVKAAIAGIDDDAWTSIKYPQAVWDEEGQCWISDAEIAETTYTAFTSKPKKQQVTARLMVRRVKRLGTGAQAAGQGTLFDTWRYHAAFTDSPLSLRDAERDHRRHAVVEQVIADIKNSAFAHAPSGYFQANAAWLTLAALAHNLTRAADALASAFHARATTATIRDHLINVPARLARSARRLTLHLPERWPWSEDFSQLFRAAHAPPPTA
ncbi:IS1380 family transposase [Streptomyces sp. F001]|uniref:IS1380 family transposase n=1 Tax=Streptomyces sp. F001 TaxID=1510026 RepID=UPI00101E3EBB|nr:IS1380 family transposase [Streptomyces sp. F001]RZB14158.1 IS1380 family transposase [Streptomyces sp. F001]